MTLRLPADYPVSPTRNSRRETPVDKGLVREGDFSVAQDLLGMSGVTGANYVRRVLANLNQELENGENPYKDEPPSPQAGQATYLLGNHGQGMGAGERGSLFGRWLGEKCVELFRANSIQPDEEVFRNDQGTIFHLTRRSFVIKSSEMSEAGFRVDAPMIVFASIMRCVSSGYKELLKDYIEQRGSLNQLIDSKQGKPFESIAASAFYHSASQPDCMVRSNEKALGENTGGRPFSVDGFFAEPTDDGVKVTVVGSSQYVLNRKVRHDHISKESRVTLTSSYDEDERW